MQIAFPTGMFAAAPLPRTAPISAIFPLNSIFDLDATLSASYSSGQVWSNIVTTPVDGSAQSAYDFNLGASNAPAGDDPTFTGTPNDPAAYFALDGGDWFTLAGAIPTFFNQIHQGSLPHTLILAMSVAVNGGSRVGLFSTTNTGSAANVGISYDTGFSALFCDQRVLATNVGISPGGISPGGTTDRLMIISYNPATNLLTRWFNTATGSAVGYTYTSTASAQVGPVPAIAARSGGSQFLPSGTRVYSCAMLNLACTNTNAGQIVKFYNKRHNRVYA